MKYSIVKISNDTVLGIQEVFKDSNAQTSLTVFKSLKIVDCQWCVVNFTKKTELSPLYL